MSTLWSFLSQGGPVMIPLGILSVCTLACALERAWFWFSVLRREDTVAHKILDAAQDNLYGALMLAENSKHLAITRFLAAPLRLQDPTYESVRLSLEAAADREFNAMQKGDKLLETVVAMAPLLGLLGTVTGLIATFANLKVGGGGSSVDTSLAANGIAESLITTAVGMVVAIFALANLRLNLTLRSQQLNYFSEIGSRLELIYLQVWCKSNSANNTDPDQWNHELMQRFLHSLESIVSRTQQLEQPIKSETQSSV